MRICVHCGEGPISESWHCSSCNFQPMIQNGHVAFAPELDGDHEGYPPDRYPVLAGIEADNFWFRSRNRLILWILKRRFPEIFNFLEIGCGTGFVLSGIASEFPDLDISASEIDSAGLSYVASRTPAARLFQMDARRIPFKDEFDLIGAFDVIEHIEDDEGVLNQIFKACKPGGGVLLTVPQHQWLWSPLDDWSRHKRRYSQRELICKVKNAGFQEVTSLSFVSLLVPLMWLSRLRYKKEKVFDPMRERTLPGVINRFFEMVMNVEMGLIKMGAKFPVGGSLLCVGRKEH